MRVRDSVTPHPLSARRPLRRYFGRKFRFSAELMVSYFHLMIASNLCFAITPVDARPSAHSAQACRCPHAILMIVIAPWIRAYQGGEYFGITGALTDPVPPQGPSVSPASRTGGRGMDS